MPNPGDQFAERLTKLETQMSRLISDIVSEKATRARSNESILSKIEHLEGTILDRQEKQAAEMRMGQQRSDKLSWMIFGGLAVVEFASRFIGHG